MVDLRPGESRRHMAVDRRGLSQDVVSEAWQPSHESIAVEQFAGDTFIATLHYNVR